MAIRAGDLAAGRVLPRTLAGATVLQLVPTLRDDAQVTAALDVARALVRAGARAIVGGEHGPMVDVLRSFGGEYLRYAGQTVHPRKLRENGEALARLVEDERIDIVHARSARTAWSAKIGTEGSVARLVAELPAGRGAQLRLAGYFFGAVADADRVLAPSMYRAGPTMERYRIPAERVSVVPAAVDLSRFDPMAVQPERVAGLRHHWGIPSGVRVILVPGRVASSNGQITLVETARALDANGIRGITFVLAGEEGHGRLYARALMRRAQDAGVESLFRIVGASDDMPAAHAAADVIALPYIAAPPDGSAAARAQAMARPVVATAVGELPESVIAPPRMPSDVRTGWVVPPGEPAELARALAEALALEAPQYRALAARARQFAEYMFSSRRVADTVLEVYADLLRAER